MKKTIKRNTIRGFGNRQFIFGDYDNDGILNIDDKNPFVPNGKSDYVDIDNKLSNSLLNTEKLVSFHNAKDKKELVDEEIKPDDLRIKTPTSALNKMVRYGYGNVKDITGTRKYFPTRNILHKAVRDFIEYYGGIYDKKTNPTGMIIEDENFYSKEHERNDGYRARHVIVNFSKNREGKWGKKHFVEVQFLTHRMAAIAKISHDAYKNGNKEKVAECKKLFDAAFEQGY